MTGRRSVVSFRQRRKFPRVLLGMTNDKDRQSATLLLTSKGFIVTAVKAASDLLAAWVHPSKHDVVIVDFDFEADSLGAVIIADLRLEERSQEKQFAASHENVMRCRIGEAPPPPVSTHRAQRLAERRYEKENAVFRSFIIGVCRNSDYALTMQQSGDYDLLWDPPLVDHLEELLEICSANYRLTNFTNLPTFDEAIEQLKRLQEARNVAAASQDNLYGVGAPRSDSIVPRDDGQPSRRRRTTTVNLNGWGALLGGGGGGVEGGGSSDANVIHLERLLREAKSELADVTSVRDGLEMDLLNANRQLNELREKSEDFASQLTEAAHAKESAEILLEQVREHLLQERREHESLVSSLRKQFGNTTSATEQQAIQEIQHLSNQNSRLRDTAFEFESNYHIATRKCYMLQKRLERVLRTANTPMDKSLGAGAHLFSLRKMSLPSASELFRKRRASRKGSLFAGGEGGERGGGAQQQQGIAFGSAVESDDSAAEDDESDNSSSHENGNVEDATQHSSFREVMQGSFRAFRSKRKMSFLPSGAAASGVGGPNAAAMELERALFLLERHECHWMELHDQRSQQTAIHEAIADCVFSSLRSPTEEAAEDEGKHSSLRSRVSMTRPTVNPSLIASPSASAVATNRSVPSDSLQPILELWHSVEQEFQLSLHNPHEFPPLRNLVAEAAAETASLLRPAAESSSFPSPLNGNPHNHDTSTIASLITAMLQKAGSATAADATAQMILGVFEPVIQLLNQTAVRYRKMVLSMLARHVGQQDVGSQQLEKLVLQLQQKLSAHDTPHHLGSGKKVSDPNVRALQTVSRCVCNFMGAMHLTDQKRLLNFLVEERNLYSRRLSACIAEAIKGVAEVLTPLQQTVNDAYQRQILVLKCDFTTQTEEKSASRRAHPPSSHSGLASASMSAKSFVRKK